MQVNLANLQVKDSTNTKNNFWRGANDRVFKKDSDTSNKTYK